MLDCIGSPFASLAEAKIVNSRFIADAYEIGQRLFIRFKDGYLFEGIVFACLGINNRRTLEEAEIGRGFQRLFVPVFIILVFFVFVLIFIEVVVTFII